MILSEEIKQAITEEYNAFAKYQYAGKTLEERRTKDQFYTPPTLTIAMIEKFDCEDLSDKKILDPTCGSGNLLAACIIAGANPKNVYGNEYDGVIVDACRKRLNSLCDQLGIERVPKKNIHQGNALQKLCLSDFSDNYLKQYRVDKIDDLKYAQTSLIVEELEELW